jgi:cellulase (glycosyl hydrolase family 5)
MASRIHLCAVLSALVLSACTPPGPAPSVKSGSRSAATPGSVPAETIQPTASPPAASDALQRRVLSELAVFTDWLARYRVQGFIGEVGWPDDATGDARAWNALADEWFRQADMHRLWVTAWATGEWWHTEYPLADYEDSGPGAGVDRPNDQAAVLERHAFSRDYLRGVNVAGGEFGAPAIDPTSSFSNATPGVAERDYHYDTSATFRYLAGRGIGLVRIPFRWERLQPALGRRLDPGELGRLRGVVRRAEAAGLQVVLDMHNYGGYYLFQGSRGVRRPVGSAQVPIRAFSDAWRRISQAFRSDGGVVGYGLMNEPVAMESTGPSSPAQFWFRASQSAVTAIRRTGDGRLILVGGYNWSGVQQWSKWQPRPWIDDPARNVRYEAHHYWDCDHSGTYARSYQEELSDAASGRCQP